MGECIPCKAAKSAMTSTITDNPTLYSDSMVRPIGQYTPAVYRFRDEQEPQNTFEDTDINRLMARVVQFRFENSLPDILYLKEVILHFTMMSDETHAPYREFYETSPEVHLSAKQFAKSALAFVKANTIYSESELFVTKDIAEKRALTCLNCPRNLKTVNGRGVSSPTLAQSKFCQLAKERTTDFDGALGVCGQCQCMNRCKIHFTYKFIEDASTVQLMQQFRQEYVGLNGKPMKCWIGEELERRLPNEKK